MHQLTGQKQVQNKGQTGRLRWSQTTQPERQMSSSNLDYLRVKHMDVHVCPNMSPLEKASVYQAFAHLLEPEVQSTPLADPDREQLRKMFY